MSEIESTLGIDRDKCIRLAMLLGSDYTDGIKGIGIVNATEVINAFPGPDGLREFREWIYSTVPDTKPAVTEETSPAIVQRLFKYKHRNMRRKLEVSVNFPAEQVMRAYWQPSVDSSTQQFEWCLPDISALRLFCQEQLSWSLAQCDQKLMPIMDALTGGELTQRRLQYFFDFDHQAGSIRSSRLNEAVGGLKRPNAQSEESSKRTRTASDTSSSQK
jgi:DNA excision repair protein ERCC-5